MVDFKFVADKLDELTTNPDYSVPGCDMILFKDGEQIFRHTTGYRDLENKIPMRGDEKYFAYSCTKVLTVAAAMTLYEKGVFLPSDKVEWYIPEWKNTTYRREDMAVVPNDTPVTVGHLLTMTAGLTHDTNMPALVELRKTNPNCTTLDVARALAKEPLIAKPGTLWNYSFGLDVIAGLIEVWSGMTFGEYVKQAIFDPLGMQDSTFKLTPEIEKEMAQQYTQEKGYTTLKGFTNEYIMSPNHESGSAGLITTLADYTRFIEGLRTGKIISKATLKFMTTPRLKPEQRSIYDLWTGKVDYNYGYGVRVHTGYSGVSDREGTTFARSVLTPIGEFGWDGAAGALTFIDPTNNVSMVYMQHQRMQKFDVRPIIMNMVYTALHNEGYIK